MMNRNLMNRQMFRDGGAAFPDLSGDGKVTQKDILIGRGVVPMEAGGMAPMLSTSDIQLFLQNFPGYLEKNGSLYDQNGNVKLEVKQTIMDLKSAEPPVNVPTPSRQPQISPEQLQIFLENNPGYLEKEGSVYGEGGNLKPGVLPPPVGMQEGGMAMAPQGMMPAAPPAAMPEMAQAQQAGMDPAVLEGMLSQASQGIMALDEAEDYEQVMNSMRETDATVEERRMELADIVGEQDAQQTPESVLTLVQPVMMMAKVDEGVGSLAQGEMTQPVTGNMAGGIMSTVNMGAEEGPAPVNFNQGGAVQYMEPGGVALNEQQQKDFDLLQQEYELNKNFYGQLIDKDAQTRALQGQQDLTQAQMLFDLANTGLAIAAPGPRSMSIAEKLAYAAQQTELFPRIGARAAELGKFKQAQEAEERQINTLAAEAAFKEQSDRRAEERALKTALAKEKAKPGTYKAMMLVLPGQPNVYFNANDPTEVTQISRQSQKWSEENPDRIVAGEFPQQFEVSTMQKSSNELAAKPIEIRNGDGDVVQTLDLSTPEGIEAFKNLNKGLTAHTLGTYSKENPTASVFKELRNSAGKTVQVVDANTTAGKLAITNAPALGLEVFNVGSYTQQKPETGTKAVTVNQDITIRGRTIKAGTNALLSNQDIASIQNTNPAAFAPYEKTDAVNPFGKTAPGLALNYFTNGTTEKGVLAIDAYAEGVVNREMEAQIKAYTSPVMDSRGFMQKRTLPDFVIEAIKKRVLKGFKSPVPLATLGFTEKEKKKIAPDQDVPLLNKDGTVNIEVATANPVFITTGLDYTNSQGFVSTLNRAFNFLAGQASELGLGDGYAGNTAELTSKGDKQLAALARKTISVGREGIEGKVFKLDLDLLKEEVEGFKAGGAKSDVGALEQLKVVRNTLASQYARSKFILDNSEARPGSFSSDMVSSAILSMRDLESLIAEYTGAILAYEANIGNRGPVINAKDAEINQGGPVTKDLNRVKKN